MAERFSVCILQCKTKQKTIDMTPAQKQELNFKAVTEMVGFEYYKICIKNGATDAQARKEMLSKQGSETIAKMIADVLETM